MMPACHGCGPVVIIDQSAWGDRAAVIPRDFQYGMEKMPVKRCGGIVLGCVLLASTTLTGCSSSRGAAGSESNDIVLNMAWWGNDSRAQVTIQAIKAFEKIHKNIKVNVSYTGFAPYFQKLTTELSGGDGPDVMQQDMSTINSYAERGALLPLNRNIIDTSTIDPLTLKTGDVNGTLYGIPTGVESCAIFYNPALLKKAGITIQENEQVTWSQYAEIANRVAHSLPGVYGTPDLSSNEAAFQFYLRELGESEYTESGKLGFDKKALVHWLNYWAALRRSGAAPPASFTASQATIDEAHVAIVTGKTPFAADFSGDAAFSDYETFLHESLGMMMYPSLQGGDKGNYPRPTMYWSVNSQSPYPKQAQELVDFLTNSETAGKILGLTRGVPVSSKVAADIHRVLTPQQKQVWNAAESAIKVSTSMSALPPIAGAQITQAFTNIVQENQFGKISSTQAADEFFAQANGFITSSET